MKTSSRSIQFGVRLLVFLNLLMAFACVWAFLRIAPSLQEINRRNSRSLESCENMLALLTVRTADAPAMSIAHFEQILKNAASNITEQGERGALARIGRTYQAAILGDAEAREQTVQAIYALAKVNRAAMSAAAGDVKSLGMAGAWGIVFMAALLFLCGILLLTRLNRGIFQPLAEIHSALRARKNGNIFRRCELSEYPADDLKEIARDVNALLDQQGEPGNADAVQPVQTGNSIKVQR